MIGTAPPPAFAPPDLAPAFAGTIVSTYPDGRTGRLWLRSNATYVGRGRRSEPSAGHWRIAGQRLCLKQSRPFPIPFSYCAPLPAAGVTSGWSGRAVTGEPITITLVPGRVGEPETLP